VLDKLITAICILLLALIPIGLIMTLQTSNPLWLWLCAPIILFLS